MRGVTYLQKTLDKIQEADQNLVAVKLACECIKRKITIAQIAARLQVAKPTVYSWFIGKTQPIKSLETKLLTELEKLKKESNESTETT